MTVEKNIAWNKSQTAFISRFILIFIVIGMLLAGSITVIYHLESNNYLQRIMLDEKHNLTLQKELIAKNFETIFADLLFLSRQNELMRFLENNDPEIKNRVENEYLGFCSYKAIYDQIRYLDEQGMEIARINYNSGTPAIVAQKDLQLKRHRYYFEEAISLNRGHIFVSPLDLNVEMGRIESPIKPMIRFGTPVFDSQGNKKGVVILNFLAGHLITAIKNVSNVAIGRVMLLNQDSFWLAGPNPDDEWGFMYHNKADRKFGNRYPEIWRQLSSTDSTQLINNNGIFTSETIYPLATASANSRMDSGATSAKRLRQIDDKGYYWKLVSHISSSSRRSVTRGLLFKLFAMGSVLFLLGSIPSYLIAKAIVRRKLHEMELVYMANYDKLTDLPNRALFMDRLNQIFNQSIRYKRPFALLFIDLDRFKVVNDTLGHDGGDELLVKTARRLLKNVRRSDTVARLGGDEFTVILSLIKNSNDAELVARKIIESLSKPFEIKGQRISIGASIGISFLFGDDGESTETLIKNADKAMYAAKKQGKNRCVKHDAMGLVYCFSHEPIC